MSISTFPQGTVSVTQTATLGTVTVSGEGLTEINDGSAAAWCILKFSDDGNVYKYEGTSSNPSAGSYTQIDTSTDWIRPTSSYSSLYQLKISLNGGSDSVTSFTINGLTKAVGSWHQITGDALIKSGVSANAGTNSVSITLEINYNGGSTLDSATYTLFASSTNI